MPVSMTREAHAADRLMHAIEQKRSPVCVGIDPVIDKLPKSLRQKRNDPDSIVQAIGEFCQQLLLAIEPHVPCVKFQSACFERYAHLGVAKLGELLNQRGSLHGMQVIVDSKRGDIGVTAEHYAASALERLNDDGLSSPADWITINSYL